MGHGSKKFFTIEVLNEVEDFDGDAIEDAHDPDDDNDGYSDIAEELQFSDPRDPNSVADTLPTDITLSHLILESQPIMVPLSASSPWSLIKGYPVIPSNDLNANVSHNHLFTIDANTFLFLPIDLRL